MLAPTRFLVSSGQPEVHLRRTTGLLSGPPPDPANRQLAQPDRKLCTEKQAKNAAHRPRQTVSKDQDVGGVGGGSKPAILEKKDHCITNKAKRMGEIGPIESDDLDLSAPLLPPQSSGQQHHAAAARALGKAPEWDRGRRTTRTSQSKRLSELVCDTNSVAATEP
ncbi:hypothetical protein THAOC_06765, partial [Thalassiosira oceanica]